MPKGSKAALWNLAFNTGDRRGDVRRSYEFAEMQFTRLSRLRCREANALGVRDAYPLASACCAAVETFRLQLQS